MSSSSSPPSSLGGVGGGEEPSSSRSRRRAGNDVWPEPFVEDLALLVASDASRSIGRLAAAQALSVIFQVCSTWQAVSHSDLLWQNLTRRIWNRHYLLRQTWREEYIYWHQTANNFLHHRYTYNTLHFVPENNDNDDNNNNIDSLFCRRLALSDHHLAAGFSDGSVQLFYIPTRLQLSTFHPHHRDRLGPFSRAVSGIILSDVQLVFASLDGDIHVVVIGDAAPPRRAHLGDVVNDGALVDFTGCDQWWVGLYAGVPGRAFHIWNKETEELLFVGGELTDPEALMGWHLLTEVTELVGRIRVTTRETAVACTSLQIMVIDLQNQGIIIRAQPFRRGLIVASFDARNETLVAVDNRGIATVRRADNLEEICRFNVGGANQRGIVGCMNGGYALMWIRNVIRVREIQHGAYLYSIRERIGDINAIIADERYLAACSSDATIHLWDFGAQ
ncbi:transcriptional regulator STERILE APETALA-like [Nicotiana tabacum]|uniref:Transcriptional regulator STERILE APETALA-like n=1 Tax=Nicotiana sylvestris TaxID=4096 RepID=A0A1U7XQ85_NICSY|nr:PREDICTED: transcriptional regulator STERILE APETALA-like [Nicotiana sylvestris]